MAGTCPSGPELAPGLAQAQARIRELDAQLQAAQRELADLTTALESNRDIGAAIGIVMVTRGVGSDVAFDLLRRASQSRHTKLRDVAREVVQLRGLDVTPPAAPVRQTVRPRPVPAPPRSR